VERRAGNSGTARAGETCKQDIAVNTQPPRRTSPNFLNVAGGEEASSDVLRHWRAVLTVAEKVRR